MTILSGRFGKTAEFWLAQAYVLRAPHARKFCLNSCFVVDCLFVFLFFVFSFFFVWALYHMREWRINTELIPLITLIPNIFPSQVIFRHATADNVNPMFSWRMRGLKPVTLVTGLARLSRSKNHLIERDMITIYLLLRYLTFSLAISWHLLMTVPPRSFQFNSFPLKLWSNSGKALLFVSSLKHPFAIVLPPSKYWKLPHTNKERMD